MITPELLREHWSDPCDTLHPMADRPYRWHGWLIGTDGRALVAIPDAGEDDFPFGDDREAGERTLHHILQEPIQGERVSLPALVMWCRRPLLAMRRRADPKVYFSEEDDEMGRPVAPPGPDAPVLKWIEAGRPEMIGRLFGVAVDRAHVLRALGQADNKQIIVSPPCAGGPRPFRFAGVPAIGGDLLPWRAAVMPLDEDKLCEQGVRIDARFPAARRRVLH